MTENYVVVDLEMTGLNPKTDCILEIGAVKAAGKRVQDEFSKLVCPNRPLDDKIAALTGISDEMAAQGEEQDTAVRQFLEFAEDFTWVGHNVMFDYRFIRQWEANHRIQRTCYAVDTLKIARVCLPGLEKKSLDFLCEYFGIKRKAKHRALDDAKATQVLYEMLKDQFLQKEPNLFVPKKMQCSVKWQTPITPRQKEYLTKLMQCHGIVPKIPVDQLCRSEASRLADRIIRQYGKI